MQEITSLLITALAVIVGIVVHETAHALVAYALGDATARSRGRVSLNPLNHIDPFGTVLLPLLMMLAGGPVFAFAKPVPVYLNNLKHPKRDEVLVALAGPASNIILAALAAGLWRLIPADGGALAPILATSFGYHLVNFVFTFISVNLFTRVFQPHSAAPARWFVCTRALPQGAGASHLLRNSALQHANPHYRALPCSPWSFTSTSLTSISRLRCILWPRCSSPSPWACSALHFLRRIMMQPREGRPCRIV